MIEKQYLLKDIRKLSPAEQTYCIEAFHKCYKICALLLPEHGRKVSSLSLWFKCFLSLMGRNKMKIDTKRCVRLSQMSIIDL